MSSQENNHIDSNFTITFLNIQYAHLADRLPTLTQKKMKSENSLLVTISNSTEGFFEPNQIRFLCSMYKYLLAENIAVHNQDNQSKSIVDENIKMQIVLKFSRQRLAHQNNQFWQQSYWILVGHSYHTLQTVNRTFA